MHEEWIDILTRTGEPTSKSCSKQDAHQNGYFHGTVHIWFYTKKGEVLLQLRNAKKINFPSLWDVSVAGHISKGETEIQAAIREVKEEIGTNISENDLQKIGVHKSMHTHKTDYIDNEFNSIFISELTTPTKHLTLQEEEVTNVKLIDLPDFEKELKSKKTSHLYVPHGETYYHHVFSEIRKVLL